VAGELLGRRLLRLDAVYCGGAGLIAIALFAPLADLLRTPRAVPVVAGAATILWAVLLNRLAARAAWRRPVAAVAAANAGAACGLVALAFVSAATAGRLLLVAAAVEVAAFAVGQALAVRRS
jgi:hypothetical protein